MKLTLRKIFSLAAIALPAMSASQAPATDNQMNQGADH